MSGITIKLSSNRPFKFCHKFVTMHKINKLRYVLTLEEGVVVACFIKNRLKNRLAASAWMGLIYFLSGFLSFSDLIFFCYKIKEHERNKVNINSAMPVTKCNKCLKKADFVTFCHKLLQCCKSINYVQFAENQHCNKISVVTLCHTINN